jgi:hypothetical protein
MYQRQDHYSTPSNKVAIRVSDYKPGVMYQSQSTGITFEGHHKELVTTCPKCSARNTAIYFDSDYLRGHNASTVCHECGIPYPVEIPA